MPIKAPARLAALLLLATTPLWASPALAHDQDRRATMTLTGTGEVTAAPDMASVTTGVVSEAKTAREALDANNKAMAEMIAAMKEAGIAAKDLQTSGFSIQPQYYHPPRPKDGSQEPPRIVGYQVSNMLTIRVRDLEMVGQVLDKAVTLGANQTHGISFGVAEDEALQDEARRKAVADALKKAQLYSSAAGVKLGPIVSIAEAGGQRPPQPYAARAMKMDAAAESVPIEGGETTTTARVNITWELAR